MKKLILALALLALSVPGFAATSHVVSVSVDAPEVFELKLDLQNNDGDGNFTGPATDVSIGLVQNGSNAQFGDNVVYAFLTALNNTGDGYTISSNMVDLSNGTTNLPDSMLLQVNQATDGNGNDISGDAPAVGGLNAVGTRELYVSNVDGQTAVIETLLAITPNSTFTGWQGVPPDQEMGTYTSQITFTMTIA